MRSPFKVLREIRHHSRRVERNQFDRVQAAGFVLFAFVAPFLVSKMESVRVRESSAMLVLVRVFDTLGNSGESLGVRATEISAKDRAMPWREQVPLADVELVQHTLWCGWPLVTSHTDLPTEILVTRTASCPATREAEVLRHARPVLERKGFAESQATTQTHLSSWIFSWGAWWVMLSVGLALLLLPLRFAHLLTRRTRTLVRQSRIDRCHCPNCGYNAKHSILRGRCPECGSELYERPDY